jgi:hypothetical protein
VKISGTIRLACPACGQPIDAPVTQSINAREHPALKAALLDGTLNMLECDRCGHRAPLEATLAYHDPDNSYFAVVVPPGGDKAGEAALAALVEGTRRLVPSRNALVEKVKILDAGLDDRVVEVLKVLLLASRGHELNAVLLFDRLEVGTLHWLLLDRAELALASPVAGYEKLAATLKPAEDLRIDRAWAVEAARTMMSNAN